MQERAREGVEVLHDLLLAEVLDVDGAEADACGLERGNDVGERVALSHEDRGAVLRLAHEVDDAVRLRLAVGKRVPRGRFAGERLVLGMRRGG